MEITLWTQISIFLSSLLVGATLSLFFDFFRIVNVVLKFNSKRVFVEDIIYFILCAFFTFIYMLVVTDGEVRFYIMLGEAVGWTIYRFTIGSFAYKAILPIIKFCLSVLERVINKTRYKWMHRKTASRQETSF